MEQEQPRDGFTARELFLMREAFKSGVSSGQMHPDHPGTLDGWLDETISDSEHYVAQMLSYDADRLYHGSSFDYNGEMTEEQQIMGQIHRLQRRYQIDAKPYIDRLVEIEQIKPPKPIFIPAESLADYPGLTEIMKQLPK